MLVWRVVKGLPWRRPANSQPSLRQMWSDTASLLAPMRSGSRLRAFGATDDYVELAPGKHASPMAYAKLGRKTPLVPQSSCGSSIASEDGNG